MKLLIIGDLHGNMPNIYYKDFDAIIAPGDFCSDAPRKYMFEALRKKIDNPKLKEFWWYDLIGRKKAEKMFLRSLADGRKILKKLNSFGVPVYVVPGNWDWTGGKEHSWNLLKQNYYKSKLIKGLKNVVDVYRKIVDIGDYQIIGHGITSGPEYPQHKDVLKNMRKSELRKAKRDYLKFYKKVNYLFLKSKKPVIFLSHNVPFNTKLDMITNKESPRYGYHYGSLIARQMIDRHKPLVCIGGHMHEHFNSCKVGKTVAINAGYGSFVNVLLELSGKKVKKIEFCNNGKIGTYG